MPHYPTGDPPILQATSIVESNRDQNNWHEEYRRRNSQLNPLGPFHFLLSFHIDMLVI